MLGTVYKISFYQQVLKIFSVSSDTLHKLGAEWTLRPTTINFPDF